MITTAFADSLTQAIESISGAITTTDPVIDGKMVFSVDSGDAEFEIVYKGGVFAAYNPDYSIRVLSFDCDHVETDPVGATAVFVLRCLDLIPETVYGSPESEG